MVRVGLRCRFESVDSEPWIVRQRQPLRVAGNEGGVCSRGERAYPSRRTGEESTLYASVMAITRAESSSWDCPWGEEAILSGWY